MTGRLFARSRFICAFAGVIASQALYVESENLGLLLSGHAEAPGSSPGVRNDLHIHNGCGLRVKSPLPTMAFCCFWWRGDHTSPIALSIAPSLSRRGAVETQRRSA